MELMQASFEGTFPDFPLPNPASGLSRIHVVTFHFFNSFNTASLISGIPNANSGLKPLKG
jgi:hypothetical protein